MHLHKEILVEPNAAVPHNKEEEEGSTMASSAAEPALSTLPCLVPEEDSSSNSGELPPPPPPRPSSGGPIRVVSFDLDDTLWSTMDTIGVALQSLRAFWQAHGVRIPQSCEVVMKQLFAAHRQKYAPTHSDGNDSTTGGAAFCPVYMTQLRLDAMQYILETYNKYSPQEAKALAQQAFDVMAKARHEAIPDHLARGAVETLQQLRQRLRSSADGTPVLIGAITNGNADPSSVAILAPYFDFCIQAEQVGVSKPDARIFTHTVQHVLGRLANQDHRHHDDYYHGDGEVGPWWVHVGDDFEKDIVGAKQMGMRTVWCREFVLPKSKEQQQEQQSTRRGSVVSPAVAKELSSWSTSACVGDGSDGSITNKNATTKNPIALNHDGAAADATIDRFADLVRVLEEWHNHDAIA